MAENDEYCVIVEHVNPYEITTETISAEDFDALCKKSQNVIVGCRIIEEKESNNGLD